MQWNFIQPRSGAHQSVVKIEEREDERKTFRKNLTFQPKFYSFISINFPTENLIIPHAMPLNVK